jgi:hypothetical protein
MVPVAWTSPARAEPPAERKLLCRAAEAELASRGMTPSLVMLERVHGRRAG